MQKEECRNAPNISFFLDRWQKDEVYRASQLAIGWTETFVKSLSDISGTSATMHLTDNEYDITTLSIGEALIPTNKQDCVVDLIIKHQHKLLSAFNNLKAKENLIIH